MKKRKLKKDQATGGLTVNVRESFWRRICRERLFRKYNKRLRRYRLRPITAKGGGK